MPHLRDALEAGRLGDPLHPGAGVLGQVVSRPIGQPATAESNQVTVWSPPPPPTGVPRDQEPRSALTRVRPRSGPEVEMGCKCCLFPDF